MVLHLLFLGTAPPRWGPKHPPPRCALHPLGVFFEQDPPQADQPGTPRGLPAKTSGLQVEIPAPNSLVPSLAHLPPVGPSSPRHRDGKATASVGSSWGGQEVCRLPPATIPSSQGVSRLPRSTAIPRKPLFKANAVSPVASGVCVACLLLKCGLALACGPPGTEKSLWWTGCLLQGVGPPARGRRVSHITLGPALKKPLPLGSEEVGRGADDERASRAEGCRASQRDEQIDRG